MYTLTLILLHQPETTAIFGSIHRLCHSDYDLSTPTLIRSSDFGNKDYCTLTLTLTLKQILFLQPETTAIFGSIHRLSHSNYDLSTPTLIRSSDFGRNKGPGTHI